MRQTTLLVIEHCERRAPADVIANLDGRLGDNDPQTWDSGEACECGGHTVRLATAADIPDSLVTPAQAARVLGLSAEALHHGKAWGVDPAHRKALSEAARRVREGVKAGERSEE